MASHSALSWALLLEPGNAPDLEVLRSTHVARVEIPGFLYTRQAFISSSDFPTSTAAMQALTS